MEIEEIADALCLNRAIVRRYFVVIGVLPKRQYTKRKKVPNKEDFKKRWDALGPEAVFKGILRLLREGTVIPE